MASVSSQLIEEVTAHAQSDSLNDAREICADGSYFPNNLHTSFFLNFESTVLVKRARFLLTAAFAMDTLIKIKAETQIFYRNVACTKWFL